MAQPRVKNRCFGPAFRHSSSARRALTIREAALYPTSFLILNIRVRAGMPRFYPTAFSTD
jgi:hypothetical protein